MARNTPEGYTCPNCVRDHPFNAYLYAHADEELVHLCDCGCYNTIINLECISSTMRKAAWQ